MREVVCWIYPPLVSSPMVWGIQNTICYQVPHHRVAGVQILLHAENSLTRLIRAVLHLLELCQ